MRSTSHDFFLCKLEIDDDREQSTGRESSGNVREIISCKSSSSVSEQCRWENQALTFRLGDGHYGKEDHQPAPPSDVTVRLSHWHTRLSQSVDEYPPDSSVIVLQV